MDSSPQGYHAESLLASQEKKHPLCEWSKLASTNLVTVLQHRNHTLKLIWHQSSSQTIPDKSVKGEKDATWKCKLNVNVKKKFLTENSVEDTGWMSSARTTVVQYPQLYSRFYIDSVIAVVRSPSSCMQISWGRIQERMLSWDHLVVLGTYCCGIGLSDIYLEWHSTLVVASRVSQWDPS